MVITRISAVQSGKAQKTHNHLLLQIKNPSMIKNKYK